MSEIVTRVVHLLNSYIKDIVFKEKKLNEIMSLKEQSNNLIKYMEDAPLKILDYFDQDFINYLVKEFDSNSIEYEAYRYVLKATREEIFTLPQYVNGKVYINHLFDYIKIYNKNITNEYETLKNEYEKILLMKKYYDMLNSDHVFVDKSDEFIQLVSELLLTYEEKVDFIVYILKENSHVYKHENSYIENEEDNLKIKRVIEENDNLLKKSYLELSSVVLEYVDLSKNIKDIIDEDLINKININNILLAKKIWLIKKVIMNYENKRYEKALIFVENINMIERMMKSIEKIKDKREMIRIIKGEC